MVASPDDMGTDAFSPSAIKTFKLCPRKWALRAIDGRESISGPAAAFGQDVHKQMELWLSKGQHPDHTVPHGAVAEAALHHWPDPAQVTIATEFHINASLDGVDFHGYQDVGFFDPITERYVVGDHKTTGDFRWSLDEHALAVDEQGMIYALAAMQRERIEEVELRWIYMRTKGKTITKPVSIVVDRAHVENTLREHVVPVARLMKKAREEAESALDLPQNPNACSDFGGCPFISDCALTPMQRMKAIMAHESLKDKLAKAKAAQKGAAAEASKVADVENPEAPGAGINPPEQKGAGALKDKLAAAKAAAPPAAPASLKDRLAAAKAAAPPVTTATAPAEAPSEGKCGLCGGELMETPTGAVCPKWKQHKAEAEAAERAQKEAAATAAARGAKEKAARHETPSEGQRRGFMLLIDCSPVVSRIGGTVMSLSDLIDIPHRELCESKDVADFRQIPHTFGGDLLAAVTSHFDAQGVPDGIVVATLGDDAHRHALPYFERNAALVVRGNR